MMADTTRAGRGHQLRIRVIACEVLARELCHLASLADTVVDVTFLEQGLHDLGPDGMRERLQAAVDAVPEGSCEAVALGYALCSRGAEGVVARWVPLVIPRAHDCVTLLMGSRERYAREFDGVPGTYYYSAGWHERDDSKVGSAMSIPSELGMDKSYSEYVELYGEENAKFIAEQLTGGLRHYERMVFLESGLGGEAPARAAAEERAKAEGWRFETAKADLSLLERLLSSDRSDEWREDFLVIAPGERIAATHDECILKGERCQSD
jgi:hypothetical protein